MKLTDTACRNAKPRDRDYVLSDGAGLNLLVKRNGSRLWRLAYRIEGRQRTLSFGRYPDISLSDARELRREARRKIAFGVDPSSPTADLERGPTFEAVAQDWLEVWQQGKNPRHVERVWARLNRDAFPIIGSRPISDIQAPDLIEMVRKVEARGALDIAKRLRQTCGQVFDFGIAIGLLRSNPSAGIRVALKKAPKRKHFVKVPMKEMPALLARMRRYHGQDMTRLALKFTLLTWVRSNETRFARWSDFEGLTSAEPLWRIPADRMKMGREHIVPLSDLLPRGSRV